MKIKIKEIKHFIIEKWTVIALYVFLFFISLVLLSQKVDFMVDELLTYNLANAEEWFEPELEVTYSPASQPFTDAMASNGTFDLRHVWTQQKYDTHPPLYYALVHAVCTLHPNSVSIRYAGIVNVLFMMLTLWVFRKILNLIVGDETAVFLASVMFVLSSGLLSMVTLLRMYVMAMFWMTLFTYLVIRHIEKYTKKDFIELFAVTVLGALTHYYCIAYVFFISVIVALVLICEKRYKEFGKYLVAMIVSGIASYLIFPAMIIHIFNDERGTESFSNLADSNFVSRIISYFNMLDQEMFGKLLGIIIGLTAFILIAIYYPAHKEKKKYKLLKYICLFVPSLCYFLLVAKSSPMFTERYISPIFALFLACFVSVTYHIISRMFGDKKVAGVIFAVVLSIVTFCGLKDYGWQYLYLDRATELENAEIYGGSSSNAICVYTSDWMVNPHYLEISKCGTVTFYKETDYDQFAEKVDENLFGEKLALFLIGVDDEIFINRFLEEHPEYTLALDNGHWGYGHSYYLRESQ